MQQRKIRKLILIAIFVALIAIGAFIKVPVPVVPFTLQLLFTMLAGLLLGAKDGFYAVVVYILMGLIGFPIFAEGGGFAYILKPSFGYLIGFAIGSYVTGFVANKVTQPGYLRLMAANFLGLSIVYSFGMIYYYLISWLYLGNPVGLWPLFLYGFLLAIPGDIALCLLGAVLAKRLIPVFK